MGKPVRKRFDLDITTEFQSVSKTFNLDKNIKFITGLLISSSRDDLVFFRGSQRIEINGEEHFPENYESKLLMSGINISPRQRYYEMGSISTGNGVVKVAYKDSASNLTSFEPYRVSLYLLAELEE